MSNTKYVIILSVMVILSSFQTNSIANAEISKSIIFIYPTSNRQMESIANYISYYLSNLGIRLDSKGYSNSQYLQKISEGSWDLTINQFKEDDIIPTFRNLDQTNLIGQFFYNHDDESIQNLVEQLEYRRNTMFGEMLATISEYYIETWIPELPLIQIDDFLISQNFQANLDDHIRTQYLTLQDRLRILVNINNNSRSSDPYFAIDRPTEKMYDQFQISDQSINFLTTSTLYLDLFNGSLYFDNAVAYKSTILDPNVSLIRHEIDLASNLIYSSGEKITAEDYIFTLDLYNTDVFRNKIDIPDYVSRIVSKSILDTKLIIDINDSRIDDLYQLGHLFPTPLDLLGGLLTIEDSQGDILFTALSDTFNPFDSVEWNTYETGTSTSGNYFIDYELENLPENQFLTNYERNLFVRKSDNSTRMIPYRFIVLDIGVDALVNLIQSKSFIPSLLFSNNVDDLEHFRDAMFDILPLSPSLSAIKLIFNQHSDEIIKHALPLLIDKTALFPIIDNYARVQDTSFSPKYTKWYHNESPTGQFDLAAGINIVEDSEYYDVSLLKKSPQKSIPTITLTGTKTTTFPNFIMLIYFITTLFIFRKKSRVK